ncbi:hypothetical protein [Pleomorphomonas sp. NRK KF1]|uniref:hypothetical protein n=1 Tax=Pleomorphomonas sp. NRK KF1 TaxID=2943000 RepID=UPI002043A7E3|nr:hypothetical protein [Pleomorphomonas sp. NRK KF1]MCM5552292.1 hypothetical protein [Pleomorphomonas sp. NRK KF1]
MSGMQFSRGSILGHKPIRTPGRNAAEIRLSTKGEPHICRYLASMRFFLMEFAQNWAIAAMQHKPCLKPPERFFECAGRLWMRVQGLESLKKLYANVLTVLNRFFGLPVGRDCFVLNRFRSPAATPWTIARQ